MSTIGRKNVHGKGGGAEEAEHYRSLFEESDVNSFKEISCHIGQLS